MMRNNEFYAGLLNTIIDDLVKIEPDGHCQVMSGILSDALLLRVLGSKINSEKLIERSAYLLDYHLETAEEYILNYKWAHGFPGLAWCIALLNNSKLIEDRVLGDMDQVDDVVGKSLVHDFDLKSYDLTVGALGKAHYFLERNNEKSREYLENIVDFLYENALGEKHNEAYWFDYYTIEHPQELVVNLGLFHGHSSIVYFLAKLYLKDIRSDRTKELLIRSLNFLEKIYFRFDKNLPNRLLYEFEHKKLIEHPAGNVQGLCHGLNSNALAFYFGGIVLNENKWLELFEEIIVGSTSMKLEHVEHIENSEPQIHVAEGKGQMNVTFCHGIMGNIYLLDKLNRTLKNEKISAHLNDLEEFLWKLCIKEGELENHYFYHKGILSGKSGLALLLMNKLGEETSVLDKLVLLDLGSFSKK